MGLSYDQSTHWSSIGVCVMEPPLWTSPSNSSLGIHWSLRQFILTVTILQPLSETCSAHCRLSVTWSITWTDWILLWRDPPWPTMRNSSVHHHVPCIVQYSFPVTLLVSFIALFFSKLSATNFQTFASLHASGHTTGGPTDQWLTLTGSTIHTLIQTGSESESKSGSRAKDSHSPSDYAWVRRVELLNLAGDLLKIQTAQPFPLLT